MTFETDKQTLEDLNLLGKYKNNSVFGMYTSTVTRAGEQKMEFMFLHPLMQVEEINQRTAMFSLFKQHDFGFPYTQDEFELVDRYVSGISGKGNAADILQVLKTKAMHLFSKSPEYDALKERVSTTIQFLKKTQEYLKKIEQQAKGNPIYDRISEGCKQLEKQKIQQFMNIPVSEQMGVFQLIKASLLLRGDSYQDVKNIVSLLQDLDAYVVVGKVARVNKFCFAQAIAADQDEIVTVKGLHHPRISGAVSNDLAMNNKYNVFFLTGANMAGKSTLMKSFGIAVYMAHMGFPIAATEMRFKILDGMYTSINVPDNINLGYSHFYAEVLRVKNVAIEISKNKRLLVIFDELFKGTNVKDAFDATLAVTEAVAERKNCAFMVSTHIIEVGEELGKRCKNVIFEYLPTVMINMVPTYTYKLEKGITEDKHGMIIINNEKIIEIIKGEI